MDIMNKKSESGMRAQKRKKQKAVDAFGGKCCICGYNKCLEALEFHHVMKEEKEEKPSYVIMRWSWERAKKELDKCILVCSNCHKEIHANEKVGLELDIQRYIKPWITKECECCSKEFQTKRNEAKYCSITCSTHTQRKVVRPSKEELKTLIETTSWVQIGRMYNVSDNAVRKWAKNYSII